MKSFKKLLAVMLSLFMIASVVVLPASAEGEATATETVTKTVNLLDWSDNELGAVNGKYPGGVSELTSWESGRKFFDGDINVVENASGKKVLQLDLSTATFSHTTAATRITENNMTSIYKLKLNIPSNMIPYVTNISMNVDKQTSAGIVYNFGVTDGTQYSRVRDCNLDTIAPATTGIVNKTVVPNNTYKAGTYHSGGAWASLSGVEKWNNDYKAIWLVMTAYGDPVDGYINIEDISYTVTAPQDVIDNVPVIKNMSIFDLSKIPAGTKRESGSATVMPELADLGYGQFSASGMSSLHSGTQEIVNVNGKNAWKIYFDTKASCGGNKYGATELFTAIIPVPQKYVGYITGITANITAATQTRVDVNFGVRSGSVYGVDKTQGAGSAIATGVTADTSREITALKDTSTDGWNAFNNGSYSNWTADKEFAELFLILYDPNSSAGGTGYAVINDITVEVTAPETYFENLPITKEFNILNLDQIGTGVIGTDVDYPAGVVVDSEIEATKTVVADEKGNKGIEIDLGSTTFTRGSGNLDKITQGGYSPVYKLKFIDIPSTYVKYIDDIKIKMNKSADSQAHIIYNFGVTDGSNYSKQGNNSNSNVGSTTTGAITTKYNPSTDLSVVSEWNAGAYGGSSTLWDASYKSLFLWLSAYIAEGETAGKLTINEVSYTATATAAEWAAADAEWANLKAIVNTFDSGLETDKAVSAPAVHAVSSGGGYGRKGFALNTNMYVKDAKGINFWVYNPQETDQQMKMWIRLSDGTGYVFNNAYTFKALSYTKVSIDFANDLGVDNNPGDRGGYTKGAHHALTAEEIAKVASVDCMIRPANVSLYVDDVMLDFKGSVANDTVTATNPTIGTVVDGKIQIPASAEEQIVEVEVPAGTFTEASSFTYQFESFASTDANVMIYTNTINDSGAAGYIKRGEKGLNLTVAANTNTEGGTASDLVMDFYGGTGGYTCCFAFEGSYYLGNDIWAPEGNRINPTSSEKAKITKVYAKIGAFGNVDAETPEYITLDLDFPIVKKGIKVTSEITADSGAVSVVDSNVFVGDTAEVIVSPANGYYAQSITATTSDFEDVELTPISGSSLGNLYTFVAPSADVKFSVVCAPISESTTQTTYYDYSDGTFGMDYIVPMSDGKGYNTNSGDYETLVDYGVILAADNALAKYGLTVDDLTPDYVRELKEKKHHLGDYIYMVDNESVVTTLDSKDMITYSVVINDPSIRALRDYISIANYVVVENAEGVQETIVQPYNSTIDGMVYGDDYAAEFDAEKGINYQGDFEADLSVWEDIKTRGFDHIRLPIHTSGRLDENDLVTEEYLTVVDTAINNALKAGFPVVLDLHTSVGISSDFATNSPKFEAIWDQLAARYAMLPESVAFELVNEPKIADEDATDPMTATELMSLQETVANNIRAVEGNENRIIVLSDDTNGYWGFSRFNDIIANLGSENLIIDFHYYAPMSFTHSGVTWGDGDKPAAGATEYDAQDMIDSLTAMKNYCDSKGVTAWVGEWGAYHPDAAAKINYFADFANAAAQVGVAWSLWEYGQGWSPYTEADGWNVDQLNALGLYTDDLA